MAWTLGTGASLFAAWEPPRALTSAAQECRHMAAFPWGQGGLLLYNQEYRAMGKERIEIRMSYVPDGDPLSVLTVETGRSLEMDVCSRASGLAVVYVDGQGQLELIEAKPDLLGSASPRRITRSSGRCHVPQVVYHSAGESFLVAAVEELEDEDSTRWRLILTTVGENGGVVAGPFVFHDSGITGAMPWAPRFAVTGKHLWLFFQSRQRHGRQGQARESIQRLLLDPKNLAVLEDEVLPAPEGRHLNPFVVTWREQVHLFNQLEVAGRSTLAHRTWGPGPVARGKVGAGALGKKPPLVWKPGTPEILPSNLDEVALDGAVLRGDQIWLTTSGFYSNRTSVAFQTLDLPSARWGAEVVVATPALMGRSRLVPTGAGRTWLMETAQEPGQIWAVVEDTRVDPPKLTFAPNPDIWQESRDLSITWAAPVDPSGLAGFGLSVTESPRTEIPIRTLGELQNRMDLVPYLREGTNWVNLAAWDRAGNGSVVVSTRILVDSSPPLITGVWCTSHPEGGRGTSHRAVLQVRGESTRPGALQAAAALVPRQGAIETVLDLLKSQAPVTGFVLTVDGLAPGTNLIAVALRDIRGRWSLPAFVEAVMAPEPGGKVP